MFAVVEIGEFRLEVQKAIVKSPLLKGNPGMQ